ncbi:unnamed protein product [Penicillium discolor]
MAQPDSTPTSSTSTASTPRGIGQILLRDVALPESIIIYLKQDDSTLQIMRNLWRLGVARNLPVLHRVASRLEALAAVCKSNWVARMLLQSTDRPISNRDVTFLWIETIPELPQPSQYWNVMILLLLSREDRMALRDALRFVAGVHAFNEAIQELEDGGEKGLFMQLADRWFTLISEDPNAEEDYVEDDTEHDTEDELGGNLEDEAFKETVEELEDGLEEPLFMQLVEKWVGMMSGDLDNVEYDTDEDLEDEVEFNT